MYRVFSQIFIQSRPIPESTSRVVQTSDINQQGNYFDICLANIFECFFALIKLVKPDRLFFTGTLTNCLIHVQLKYLGNRQNGLQSTQEIHTVGLLYFYLTYIFNRTGLGNVLLTHLLTM